tara:strand:- start:7571 stop:7726 length:156 start_codon:yes stop_codon:yes gene_type:complete
MTDKIDKQKLTADQKKIIDEMAPPPGEFLVPLEKGLTSDTTWITKLKNKIR